MEQVNPQSAEVLKTFNLIKQIEELIELYRVNSSEFSDIEVLKKFLHGYHAANLSPAKLQLSLETGQHFSNEFQSAVTLSKQIFTNNLPSTM